MGAFSTGLTALLVTASAEGEGAKRPPRGSEGWSAAQAEQRLVVETIGEPRLGRDKMHSALESALGDLAIKAKKPKRGKRPKKASQLAKAAKSAGAQWLLLVELNKQKGRGPSFAASVQLIDANTGAVALRFDEEYGKGGAIDAGKTIAGKAIEHLMPKVEEPVVEAPPPPPPPPKERDPHPGWTAADPIVAEETRTKDPPSEAFAAEPVPVQQKIETMPEPAIEPKQTLGRVRLGGGSGWLRSVSVSAQTLEESSGLSYTLGPTSLFELSAEVVIPGVGLGAAIDLGLRPVHYSIDTGTGEAADPRGLIFDMLAVLIYRLAFGAEDGIALIPHLGVRLSLATIESHPMEIIPASTTVAAIGGLSLRIPIGDRIELEAGGHGGWIPVYAEKPTDSGKSKGGFTAGGHLALRIWIIAGLGISLDNRAGYDRLSFEERPTRGVPPGEDLENAAIGLFELKSTLSVVYRF